MRRLLVLVLAVLTLGTATGCGDDREAAQSPKQPGGPTEIEVLETFSVSPHPDGVEETAVLLPDDPVATWDVWATWTPKPSAPVAPDGTQLAFVWGGVNHDQIDITGSRRDGTALVLTGTRDKPGPNCGLPAVVWGTALVVAVPDDVRDVTLDLTESTTNC